MSDLVARAADVYHADPAALEALDGLSARLHGPVRVAVAGMVKAGKSTLLNAIIGEEIAPTDAGECTKVITWYKYGDVRRITLHREDGGTQSLPVRRRGGRLTFPIGDLVADDISHFVVEWPAASLRDVTLIDTPGIASVHEEISNRTTGFLAPVDELSQADAVLYLMRHLHSSDVEFLKTMADRSGGAAAAPIAVLSRVDEVGAGRIDSLLSARSIADRYRTDEALRELTSAVIPVAGLLAQSARTLRQAEFAVLAELAVVDRPEREKLLASADRFAAPSSLVTSSPAARAKVLDRFGLFGIRLATVLIRNGVTAATALSHDLVHRSGLDDLLAIVLARVTGRSGYLRAEAALTALETILRRFPIAMGTELEDEAERIRASAHDPSELRLLAALADSHPVFSAEMRGEAARLLGDSGTSPAERLGLPAGSTPRELQTAALAAISRWRIRSEHPLADLATVEACRTVVRSCEGIIASVDPASELTVLRLRSAAQPSTGAGQEFRDERQTG